VRGPLSFPGRCGHL